MNRKEIKREIEDTEEHLNALKAKLEEPEEYAIICDKQTYFINVSDYDLSFHHTFPSDVQHGRYRQTENVAAESVIRNKEANRLEALVEDVTIKLGVEDWVAVWGLKEQYKHTIYLCRGEFVSVHTNTYKGVGAIYMPEIVAEEVCRILNEGRYKL
jgi:hypothetical protein